MSALRVGLFTECYRPIQNGIVASIDALAHTLRSSGHAAVVVTPEMPGYRDTERDVVRVPSLPLPTRTAYRLTVPYLPRAIGPLSIVHAHSPFVTGWLGVRAARRAGVPLVFTYHTQLEAYAHYVPFESNATRGAATLLTRVFANGADAVIVPTRAMEARLRALGVLARIDVVPSGIDRAFFAGGRRKRDVRARFGVGDDAHLVLSVGRLGREKNLELALQAFARLDDPAARLVVVGDGVHRPVLERLAARLHIAARTTFAGEYARLDLPDVYASADAFVFTSRSDTQGLVLVEALAAGTPVVAVDTPQTRDVLADAGIVCANDSVAVAAALRAALAGRRPDARLGAVVARTFDGPAIGGRVIALYDSLVAAAPVRELVAALP
ncbi:MAG: glycosyltransferase family 4 protein [Vulcanimicrobiaceae bacterium]